MSQHDDHDDECDRPHDPHRPRGPYGPFDPLDGFPPVHRGGGLTRGLPRGMVVDRWNCPACPRMVDIVYRPGRPRLYCSHACRQRAYRWRRRRGAHTVATASERPESAMASSHERGMHALRTARDPLSQRRDRRSREVTVCGLLARPTRLLPLQKGVGRRLAPFGPSTCRTCEALIQARPLGLVPPDAMPPPWRSPWERSRPDSPPR